MGFYNSEINGFVPQQNEEGTLPEYTDEQINEMFKQGNVVAGADGKPMVVPIPQPTAEEKQAQYESLVDQYIRQKYTLSQELAIIRQQAAKQAEYDEYFEFCEECKAKAKAEVYGK